MEFTKKQIIQKLYELEEKYGLKLGREVQKVIRNEIIPIEVIKLINKYDSKYLQIYDTVNTIYNSRYKNPLYKNLRKTNLPIGEVAVAISSFVTKILISCTKINDNTERQIFCTAMNLEGINKALTDYALYNKPESMIECHRQIRELLELLFVD